MKWPWKKKKKEEPFEELWKAIHELCKVGREYTSTIDKLLGK